MNYFEAYQCQRCGAVVGIMGRLFCGWLYPHKQIETEIGTKMTIGKTYNWKNQNERMVFMGIGTGASRGWYQFSLKGGDPFKVWCEVLYKDLDSIEETKD